MVIDGMSWPGSLDLDLVKGERHDVVLPGPHGRAFALEVASTPSPVTRHALQVVMSVYVLGGTGKKVGTLFSCGGKPELQVLFFFFNCKKPTS